MPYRFYSRRSPRVCPFHDPPPMQISIILHLTRSNYKFRKNQLPPRLRRCSATVVSSLMLPLPVCTVLPVRRLRAETSAVATLLMLHRRLTKPSMRRRLPVRHSGIVALRIIPSRGWWRVLVVAVASMLPMLPVSTLRNPLVEVPAVSLRCIVRRRAITALVVLLRLSRRWWWERRGTLRLRPPR